MEVTTKVHPLPVLPLSTLLLMSVARPRDEVDVLVMALPGVGHPVGDFLADQVPETVTPPILVVVPALTTVTLAVHDTVLPLPLVTPTLPEMLMKT
jgi:hypothetical protein